MLNVRALSLTFALLMFASAGAILALSDLPSPNLDDTAKNPTAVLVVLAIIFALLAGPMVTPVLIWVLRVCRPVIACLAWRVVVAVLEGALRKFVRWILAYL